MKKLMLLAAMLAMVLVAAAPALAQASAVQYDDSTSDDDVSTRICTNIVRLVAGDQYNSGDADAASVEGDATSEIAQELGITIKQVNNCLNTTIINLVNNGADDDGDGTVDEPDEAVKSPDTASPGTKSPGGIAKLPDTGGAPLFTLGAGVLLIGGGMLARRIFG